MGQVERFMNIQQQIKELSGKKIRIEERCKAETEKLEKLIAEIREKGYDPTKLAEIKDIKEKELEKSLVDLEALVEEVSKKLQTIEEQNAIINS